MTTPMNTPTPTWIKINTGICITNFTIKVIGNLRSKYTIHKFLSTVDHLISKGELAIQYLILQLLIL